MAYVHGEDRPGRRGESGINEEMTSPKACLHLKKANRNLLMIWGLPAERGTISDLISRQAALNQVAAIDTSIIPYARAREYVDELKNYVIKVIETLPSAEPERTAKVIDKSVGRHSISDFDWIGKCEKCGNEIQYSFDFCPYCGAELEWSE